MNNLQVDVPALSKVLEDLDDKIQLETKAVQELVDSRDMAGAGIRAAIGISAIQDYILGIRQGLGLVQAAREADGQA